MDVLATINAIGTLAAAAAAIWALQRYRNIQEVDLASKLIEAWSEFNKYQIESGYLDRHGHIISHGVPDKSALTKSDENVILYFIDVILLHFIVARHASLDNDLIGLVLKSYAFDLGKSKDNLLAVIPAVAMPQGFVDYLNALWSAVTPDEIERTYKRVRYFSGATRPRTAIDLLRSSA